MRDMKYISNHVCGATVKIVGAKEPSQMGRAGYIAKCTGCDREGIWMPTEEGALIKWNNLMYLTMASLKQFDGSIRKHNER